MAEEGAGFRVLGPVRVGSRASGLLDTNMQGLEVFVCN